VSNEHNLVNKHTYPPLLIHVSTNADGQLSDMKQIIIAVLLGPKWLSSTFPGLEIWGGKSRNLQYNTIQYNTIQWLLTTGKLQNTVHRHIIQFNIQKH